MPNGNLLEPPVQIEQPEQDLLPPVPTTPMTEENRNLQIGMGTLASINLGFDEQRDLSLIPEFIDTGNRSLLEQKLSSRDQELAMQLATSVALPLLAESNLQAEASTNILLETFPELTQSVQFTNNEDVPVIEFDPSKSVIEKNAVDFILTDAEAHDPFTQQLLADGSFESLFTMQRLREQTEILLKLEQLLGKFADRAEFGFNRDTVANVLGIFAAPIRAELKAREIFGIEALEAGFTADAIFKLKEDFSNRPFDEQQALLEDIGIRLDSGELGDNDLISLVAFDQFISMNEEDLVLAKFHELEDVAFTLFNISLLTKIPRLVGLARSRLRTRALITRPTEARAGAARQQFSKGKFTEKALKEFELREAAAQKTKDEVKTFHRRTGPMSADATKTAEKGVTDPVNKGVTLPVAVDPAAPRIKGLTSGAKRLGNKRLAIESATQTATALQGNKPVDITSQEELLNEILPTGLNPHSVLGESLSSEIVARLDENAKRITGVFDSFKAKRLTTDEKLAGIEATKLELQATADAFNIHIKDFNSIENVLDQTVSVSAVIGNGVKGFNGFTSTNAARAAAKRMSLPTGSFSIINPNNEGRFFLQMTRTMQEQGLTTKSKEILADRILLGMNINALDTAAVRFEGNKFVFDADAAAGAELSVRLQQKVEEQIAPIVKQLNKLNQSDKGKLGEALAFSHQSEKFMTLAELEDFFVRGFNEAPSEKVLEAYFGTIQLNNFAYFSRNIKARTDLARLGFQEIRIKGLRGAEGVTTGGAFNGKLVNNIPTAQGRTIFDEINSKMINIGDMSAAEIELHIERLRANNNDVVIVKAVGPIDGRITVAGPPATTGQGEGFVTLEETPTIQEMQVKGAEFILTTRDKVGISELRARQIGYIEGGSRIYSGSFFIKQTNMATAKDGQRIIKRPKTISAFDAFGEAKNFADDFNRAQEAYNIARTSGIDVDIANATRLIDKLTPYSSFQEWDRLVAEGAILRTPFEVTEDRIPTKFGTTPNAIFIEDELTGLSDEVLQLVDNGRLFFSRRGQRLRHPREGFAPILNPLQTLQKSLSQATRTVAFTDNTLRQSERFVQRFGNLLVGNQGNHIVTRALTEPFITRSEFISRGGNLAEFNKAASFRSALQRLVNTPTTSKIFQRNVERQLLKAVTNRPIDELPTGRKALAILSKKLVLSDRDISDVVTGFTFDLMLGFYDFGQVLVQHSMLPGIVGAFPISASRAVSLAPFLKIGFMADRPEVWERLATIHSVMFPGVIKKEQFLALVEDFRRSGAHLVGGTQAQLDQFGPQIIGKAGKLRRGGRALREGGRGPFKFAEGNMRAISFATAWFDNGGVALKSQGEIDSVAILSETLAGNMTRSSRAWWQTGIFKPFAQFAGFVARMGEILLLNQEQGLSAKRRLGFVGGLTLFTGAIGAIPFADDVYDFYLKNTNQLPSQEVHTMLTRGLLGSMLEDVDFTTRLSAFGGITLFDKLVDLALGNGSDGLAEIAIGPSATLFNETFEAVNGFVFYTALLFDDEEELVRQGFIDPDEVLSTGEKAKFMFEEFLDLGKAVSSLSRATQGYYAFKYDEFRTRQGRVLETGLTDRQAFFITLGFPPFSVSEAFEAGNDVKIKTKALREMSNEMLSLTRRMFDLQREGEDEAAKEVAKKLSAFGRVITGNRQDEQGLRDMQVIAKNVFDELRKTPGTITEQNFLRFSRLFGRDLADLRFQYEVE